MAIEEGRADMGRPAGRPGDIAFPPRLNASPDGWLDDQDRDSQLVMVMKAIQDNIDELVADFHSVANGPEALNVAARIVRQWERLRRLQK